jgi:hypothetical protein
MRAPEGIVLATDLEAAQALVRKWYWPFASMLFSNAAMMLWAVQHESIPTAGASLILKKGQEQNEVGWRSIEYRLLGVQMVLTFF